MPPAPGKQPALLTKAPYGVWTQQGREEVTFDFVLQILSEDTSKYAVERLEIQNADKVSVFRIAHSKGGVTIIFDERTSSQRKPFVFGKLQLLGRVGVAFGSCPQAILFSDGILECRP